MKFKVGDKLKWNNDAAHKGRFAGAVDGGTVEEINGEYGGWYSIRPTSRSLSIEYVDRHYDVATEDVKERKSMYVLELQRQDGGWITVVRDGSLRTLEDTTRNLHDALKVRMNFRIRDYVTGRVVTSIIYSGVFS